MKRRTWLRLNVGPCSAHAYEMDKTMDDGLKKIYEKEETKRRMQANTNHELEMIKQQQKAEAPLFKDIDPRSGSDWDEKRMDIIGQNGNNGEHYNRGNWWGLADDWDESDDIEASKKEDDAKYTGRNKEPDATGMEEDPPSAAEDCARQRGNYEI